MAVIYDDGTKEERLNATLNRIGPGAKLEIGTTGMASVLVTFTLDDPPGTASNGLLTFAGFPKTEEASASGTAAAARIRTSGDADRVTGLTVGTSGTDVILDVLSITSGQNVVLNSATITHG